MTDNPPAADRPAEEPAEEPAQQTVEETGVQAQLRALRTDLEVLDQVVSDFLHPADDAGPPGSGDGPFEPVYSSLEEWVLDYFAPMFSRPSTPAIRWCAQWWDHAEAISGLEALWRSWETHRLDPLRGMAVWYRDFLDGQLAVLAGRAVRAVHPRPARPVQAAAHHPGPRRLLGPGAGRGTAARGQPLGPAGTPCGQPGRSDDDRPHDEELRFR